MALQVLVVDLSVTLGPGATSALIPHGLRLEGGPVAPNYVIPNLACATKVVIANTDETFIQFTNPGTNAETVLFHVEHRHTIPMGDAPPILWQGLGPNTGGTTPTLVSLAVTPNPSAGMLSGFGTKQQFTATGTYSDASTANLTDAVAWSSDNAGTASFGPDGTLGGVLTANNPGSANVRATLGLVVSPAVAVAVTLGADFTAPAVPAHINGTRAAAVDPIYPTLDNGKRMGSAIVGGPIYEWRRGPIPGGWWSFKGYTNAIPDPFDLINPVWDGVKNWYNLQGIANTLVAGAKGPDGAAPVYLITPLTPAPFPEPNWFAFYFLTAAVHPYDNFFGSVKGWFRAAMGNPASIAFLMGCQPRSIGNWQTAELARPNPNGALDHAPGGGALSLGAAPAWEVLATMSVQNPVAGGGALVGACSWVVYPSTKHGLMAFPFPFPGAPITDGTHGAVQCTGAQLTSDADFYVAQAISDVPLIHGATGDTDWNLATPAQGIPSGELDVEVSLIPGMQDALAYAGPRDPGGGANPAFDGYIFYFDTPNGEVSLRWALDYIVGVTHFLAMILRINGVDEVISLPVNQDYMLANNDQEWKARAWFKGGQAGIRIGVNEAYQPAHVVALAPTPLLPPTAAHLLVNPNQAPKNWPWPGQLTRLEIKPADVGTGEPNQAGMGVACGDSLMCSIAFRVAAASYIYTAIEARAGGKPPIAVLAQGGKTVAQQLATYTASIYPDNPNVAWLLNNAGINDIILGQTAAQITADIQATVDFWNLHNPTAKKVWQKLSPAFGYFTAHPNPNAAAMEAIRLAVNANIDGSGGTPIVGLDGYVEDHLYALTDPTDGQSLAPQFDTGSGNGAPDGLHYNSLGFRVVGYETRKVLNRLKAIP